MDSEKQTNTKHILGKILLALIICGVLFVSFVYMALRERTLLELPASSLAENPALGLKSKIVLRHHFVGGLGGESYWGWYLIIENDKGEQFESKIPFRAIPNKTNDEKEINSLKAKKFEISWNNQYMLSITSSSWPGVTRNAYFVSGCLHVFDETKDRLISNTGEDVKPLSEGLLGKLKLLELDKDVLKNLRYINLPDHKKTQGTLINEDPNVLLYAKDNRSGLMVKVFSLGPILIEGECGLRTIVSSQWVFYNNTFPDYLEVYADQVFVNSSDDEYFKSLNTTPIVLTDKK